MDIILNFIYENFNDIAIEFLALFGTLLVGIILFMLYNSFWVIRKRTETEAIQKLKLDSIIEIINGAYELLSGVSELCTLLTHASYDMLEELRKQNYSQVDHLEVYKIVIGARNKFFRDSSAANEKIEKFSFLLAKEFMLNKKMSREQDVILKEFLKVKDIREEIINEIHKVHNATIDEQGLKEVGQKFVDLIQTQNDKVDNFILPLMDIYRIKLHRKQESWFRKVFKFLNFFIFVFRNRNSDIELEEILEGMEK